MTLSTLRPALPAPYGEEYIDVVQIRLWNGRSAMALVSEFHCAERVLADWAQVPGRIPVRFEVRFADDHVVKGAHEFFRNGKRRCLLTTHLRRLLSDVDAAPPPLPLPVPRARTRQRYLLPR